MACGTIQKPLTEPLLADMAAIYADYDVYYQGGGAEQLVLDGRDGRARRRSEVLVERLNAKGIFDRPGNALDVGCGNGVFLAAIADKTPAWRLDGLDLDDRHEASLNRIPGFGHLIAEDILTLAGCYDFISAVHALEHLPDPRAALAALRNCLAPDGVLFIQAPNIAENPFDILIADHVSHFTPATLSLLLGQAGFRVVSIETDWIGKELSVLAVPTEVATELPATPEAFDIGKHIAWLRDVQEEALLLSQTRRIGLFGTSIAATWLAGSIGADRVAFFVDEDPARQGRPHFGRRILAPSDVPVRSIVYFCLAPAMAGKIAARMAGFGFCCITPRQEMR
ncbi:class I SAM-dependent methyltransferase [Dongia sp.]|uniref:class I SAM-dependent methyltransferase n=1 Tax=Dongia sp. TaxID=1977262 RepID=UPI0035AE0760